MVYKGIVLKKGLHVKTPSNLHALFNDQLDVTVCPALVHADLQNTSCKKESHMIQYKPTLF
jgi:hypothetical protein